MLLRSVCLLIPILLVLSGTGSTQINKVDEGKSLMDNGRFDEAIEYLLSLLEQDPYHPEQGRILRYIAVAHATNMEEDDARTAFIKAIDHFKRVNDSSSEEYLLSHFDFGQFNFQFNEFTSAIEHMNIFLLHSDQALKIDTNKLYAAHSMISYSFRRVGDFEKALEHLQRKYELLERHGKDESYYAIVHYYFAGIYYEMSEYQKSVDHFEKCITLWERDSEKYKNRLQVSYSAAGDMYWKLGERDKSLNMYDKEAGIKYEKAGTYDEEIDDDVIKNEKLNSEGDYEKLLSYFQDALNYRKAQYGDEHPVVAGCNNYVADAFSSMGRKNKSLALYQESICLLVKGFNDTSILALPKIDAENHSELYLLEAIEDKASILFELYETENNKEYLTASYEHFKYAIDLIDKIRSGNKNDLSKLFWSDRSFPIYEKAINCCYELSAVSNNIYFIEAALNISERSKAFLLMETLREAEINDFANVPGDLLKKERELEVQIYDYNQKIFYEGQKCGEISDYKIDLWKDKVYALSREHDKLIATLRKHNSEYYELKYSSEHLEASDIQRNFIAPGDLVLEYFFGTEFLYVFCLSQKEIQWKRIPVDSALNTELHTLRDFVLNVDQSTQNTKREFISLSYKYYKLLMSDFEEHFDAKLRNIIIIPDGVLHYLAFESLLTEESGEENDFRRLPYLLRRSSVSYANSMNTLFRRSENRQRSFSTEFAGFAPSYAYSKLISSDSDRSTLYDLKFNANEIQDVSGYFDSQIYIGEEATVERFKKEAPDSKIIHLAMHSVLEDQEPMFSRLLFSRSDHDDGVLNAYELFGLTFNADLAVLSACNTGVGTLARGEGVMSLSRGFQYANIPSLIVSLWTVDDMATSNLIKHFYKNLQDGASKAEALQIAKLSFLDQADPAEAHPYYWAGLKLIGKNDVLVDTAVSPILIILSSILCFGLLIIGISKLR